MIFQKINFYPLYEKIDKIFSKNLPKSKFNQIRKALIKEVKELANANFRCYQANMTILEERRKNKLNTRLISDMELQARTTGECRVKTKATINRLLNKIYPSISEQKIRLKSWVSDDIVYSVGEMIDRITIEFIKINDYNFRLQNLKEDKNKIKELKQKIGFSKAWSQRVEKYLGWKLREINKKNFYEYLEETRTYDAYLKTEKLSKI